jgi:hypothetical protein
VSATDNLRGYQDAIIPAALHDTNEVSCTDAVYSDVAGTLSCHMAGDRDKDRPVTFLFAAGETKRISVRTVRSTGTVTIVAANLRLLYSC